MNLTIRLVRDNAVFATLQGEGDLSGAPSTFVRTAGCDLRCARDPETGRGWSCDTPNSLPDYDHKLQVFRPQPTKHAMEMSVQMVAAQVMATQPSHIVITGGEPTLQDGALRVLLALIEHEALLVGRRPHVTLETNARRFSAVLARCIDLASLSPKVYQPATISFQAIADWCKTTRSVQVKIVMADLDPEAQDMAVSVFQSVRALRQDASLYVQRADTGDDSAVVSQRAQQVIEWVKTHPLLRALGVRYGIQQHKVIGIP